MRMIFKLLTAMGFALLFGTAGASDRGMEFATVVKLGFVALSMMGVGLLGNYWRAKR